MMKRLVCNLLSTDYRLPATVYRAAMLAGLACLLVLTACTANTVGQPAQAKTDSALLVAAASNLQFAFTDLAAQFEQQTGQPVRLVFGSSGKLTAQIENGAPFDILASADESYIDRLASQDLLLPDTRRQYAQGQLALVANRQAGLAVDTLDDLLSPAVRRVAIANPEHAPYGTAAMQALQQAGLWEQLQPKLVLAETVRQALQFVQTGDATAGIVALSIADVPEVTAVPLPPTLHQPLHQAMA
ncbi:MAG: molybdate ABC transporter substrate-binding protein, partial [Chloroflexi bacterium]